jgi:hypothetical protein
VSTAIDEVADELPSATTFDPGDRVLIEMVAGRLEIHPVPWVALLRGDLALDGYLRYAAFCDLLSGDQVSELVDIAEHLRTGRWAGRRPG